MPLLNEQRDAPADARHQYLERVVAAVEAVPGVSSVALTSALPLMGDGVSTVMQSADRGPLPEADRTGGFFKMVTPDYFATLRLDLRRGRSLTKEDRAGTPRVTVINETAARLMFPNVNPVGRMVLMPELVIGPAGRFGADLPWQVVGVVEDERTERLRESRTTPGAYVPMAQSVSRAPSIVVRMQPLAGAELAIRGAVADVNRDQALANARWLDRMLEESMGSDRQRSWIVSFFAVSALLLAAIGIYGVMSQLVAARTHELGVRAAVGARAGQLAGLVLRDGLWLAGVGVVLGVLLSLGTSRLLRAWLENLAGVNPATVIVGALVMAVVAGIACLVPARRATRVDPLLALRAE
jgi:predicted permease